MAHRTVLFLAFSISCCVWQAQAQPQENVLEYVRKTDQGLTKDATLQQRRAALREATARPKSVLGQNAPTQPTGRQLSPQERAELRQQLRHQRHEVPSKTS
jgi:hypothetical protein